MDPELTPKQRNKYIIGALALEISTPLQYHIMMSFAPFLANADTITMLGGFFVGGLAFFTDIAAGMFLGYQAFCGIEHVLTRPRKPSFQKIFSRRKMK